jgi:TadE-like protein
MTTPGSTLRRRWGERGAAAVEMAVVLGILLMIAVGTAELGFAFQNYQGVAAASREAARVGSSAGSDTQADCRILEAAASALFSTSGVEVVRVDIAERNPANGSDGLSNGYRPFDPSTDDPSSLRCGAWFQTTNSWAPSNRDDEGADRDWISVTVVYEHQWRTDFLFFTGTVEWDNTTAMRFEPETF